MYILVEAPPNGEDGNPPVPREGVSNVLGDFPPSLFLTTVLSIYVQTQPFVFLQW